MSLNYKGSGYGIEERIKLAGEEKKDRLYEAKENKKAIKVLTVIAYVFCVSIAAIMLSSYYVFLWSPSPAFRRNNSTEISNCEKIIFPLLKILVSNDSNEISAETFAKNFSANTPSVIQFEKLKKSKLFERIIKMKMEQKQAASDKGPSGEEKDIVRSSVRPSSSFDDSEESAMDENDDDRDTDDTESYEQSGNGNFTELLP